MTDTFNPYSATSTGHVVTADSLYNEPLFIWNILNPSEAPYQILATGYSWSNGGKTLTLTTRSGVKWNDGKPFSASDVAFTFNMIRTHPGLDTDGTPVPVSATAPSATPAVLTFAQPQYANLFLIGQTYIVPQHIWSTVNPATFADPNPVGTGPFMLDKFTPQGFTLKPNPYYWDKSAVHVPEIDYPSYSQNFNIVNPLASGQIDLAGNDIANVQGVYLAKSPDNHTYIDRGAVLHRQQRGVAVLQRHQGAAERPGGAPGGQLRDQPAAAVGAGRDRLRAARDHDQRAAAARCEQLPDAVAGQQPARDRRRRPRSARSSPPTAGARSAASGPRTARRSPSRSPTRSPTATTTSDAQAHRQAAQRSSASTSPSNGIGDPNGERRT